MGDFEEDPDDVAPVNVGVPQRNIVPMNDTLTAKVELIHLMEKNKLHMNVTIRTIWDWTVRSQSQVGHKFSLTQHCTRSTIFKDMQSHYCHSLNPDNSETIVEDEFSWVMTTVLPDHTPVDLFVHPFQEALNFLLLQPELMDQSKLSLPNVHNPLFHQ